MAIPYGAKTPLTVYAAEFWHTRRTGLASARERLRSDGRRPYDQLYSLVYGQEDDDPCAELTTIIAEMEIDEQHDGSIRLIYDAKKRFPYCAKTRPTV